MGLMDFFRKGKEVSDPQQKAQSADTGRMQTQAQTYTVKSGDSLSKIAKQFYGDAQKWHRIYEANKDIIGSNPDMIHPGQTFKIPQ
jgi:nucleoid-associated protein YgaU